MSKNGRFGTKGLTEEPLARMEAENYKEKDWKSREELLFPAKNAKDSVSA